MSSTISSAPATLTTPAVTPAAGGSPRFLPWNWNLSLLAVRVIVGSVFAVHGAQKMFGSFDGIGLAEFVKNMGLLAYPVAIGEFFGGLGLIVGFLTRFSAASNILIMIGAIVLVHGQHGFLLSNSGYEYNLALIGLLLPLVLIGPGNWSVAEAVMPRSRVTGRVFPVIE